MSTVRLLVLGTILRRGVSHGYGVYNDLTSWRAETWTNVKPGSIYHALEKLEAQGLTRTETSDPQVKLGPSRTEYSVTEQGKTEFETLLRSALQSFEIQTFAVGIAFMDMLPRREVLELLERRASALKESAAFLRTLPTEEAPSEPSKHPELVGIWEQYVENELSGTLKLIGKLESGTYKFAGENG
ncbi:PadR family transcriptional regulator [Paenibacillus sp. VCA1]|uniref:PadR family transcriptional regulator n=1 Tax=Paenibacillus sp. VCA1 TaxID=3039148 RepID=UPI002870FB84|nr:PadR family transcriptional regulator [Paenibacillus sp. VCA1]MDR9854975.1 PadR family transcriptional regulator [Paenibacillus sp. VCA1]